MNIIVTKKEGKYENFLKVDSLKEVNDLVGSIDTLVYHTSDESTEDKVQFLSKIKDRVKLAVYVRNKDQTEQAIRMIILGSGGKYVDDEFFLENGNELQNLINGIDEVTALVELGGTSVLGDFFNRYLDKGSTDFSSSYLAVVKDAVTSLTQDYKKKSLELIQMSETATELFSHSAELISNIREEERKLKEAVLEIQKVKDTIPMQVESSARASYSAFFFPTVNYLKERNIIRIKMIGDAKYVVSFCLGLRIHLENVINKRPKLIFLMPVGTMYETIYKGFNWVTQLNHKNLRNYYNKVVFVSYPNKDVMSKLLDDTDFDTFIVVDMLKNAKTHLLNSKGSSVKYVLGSESAIAKFGLKVSDCFTSIVSVDKTLFAIPMFPSYPKEASQRERLYIRECATFYNMLI